MPEARRRETAMVVVTARSNAAMRTSDSRPVRVRYVWPGYQSNRVQLTFIPSVLAALIFLRRIASSIREVHVWAPLSLLSFL